MGHHALVFGASGILGWGVVDQILKNYPARGTFGKVTALSHRPLSAETAFWPSPVKGETPELCIVDGIDLTTGTVDELKETLRARVPDIDTVTHIHYFAYKFHPDFPTESEINLGMLRRGFGAAEALAPKLEYVIFPTGTKGYGIHVNPRPFEAPFTEEMSDVPLPFHKDLFYYILGEELNRMQKDKAWKWAEVRCGPVLGFVPHRNPYNLPAIYMNFLSLYKFMHEQGHPTAASARVPFPGPAASYHTVHDDGGQDVFARFSIHLCLSKPANTKTNNLYNIGDTNKPLSMADRWPVMCALFGLEGVPPPESANAAVLPVSFVGAPEHADMLDRLNKEKGVALQEIELGKPLEGWMEHFTFNHHMVLDKARATRFGKEQGGEVGWEEAWRTVVGRYVRAGKAYLG